MEKITRTCCMNFAFKEGQDEQSYLTNMNLLQKVMKECEAYAKQFQGIQAVCAFPYNKKEGEILSSFMYKEHMFLGLYNAKDQSISFHDKHCEFAKLDASILTNFSQRIKNSIDRENEGIHLQYAKGLEKAWEDKIPLLNKLIEYDKTVESAPDVIKNRIKHSLEYDKQIDRMINTYGDLDRKEEYNIER